MIKITEQPKTPIYQFECNVCGTKYATDEWVISEVPNPYGGLLFTGTSTVDEKAMKRCPTCKHKVFSSKLYVAIENVTNG